jgi:hypothetical protein
MAENVIVKCPHCNLMIFVYLKEFNCRIFRHGIYKHNLQQIDPHLPKVECDRLKANDLIIGCGKPFMLVDTTRETIAVKCDYV